MESADAMFLQDPMSAAYCAGRESFHAISLCHIDLEPHRNHGGR